MARAPKQPKRPTVMPAAKLTRAINSPWRSIGSEISKVSDIYYPEPTISMPQINWELVQQRMKTAQERSTARNGMGNYMLQYNSQKQIQNITNKNKTIVAGLLTDGSISQEQYDRLPVSVQQKLDEFLNQQYSISDYGEQPIEQNKGLVNRVFDILSRFEYAGATNEHENAKRDLSLMEAIGMGPRMVVDPLKQALSGNRSQEQMHYDYLISHKAELEDSLARIKSGELQMLPGPLREELDAVEFELRRDYGGGSHLPTSGGGKRTPTYTRPTDDYETIYETERYKQIKRKAGKGKLGVDIVPGIIPTNAKERESWIKGFTGVSKRTYTMNLMEDKGWSSDDAFGPGLTMAILLDPTTYITGGMIKGGVGLGAKSLGVGRAGKGLLSVPTLEKLPDLLKTLEKGLSGTKLRLGGKTFTIGEDGLEEFNKLVAGGPWEARQATSAAKAKHQKRILTEFTDQVNSHIKKSYADLNDELMSLKKTLKKASDPTVIEQQFVNLANKVSAMNLDKGVTDALEDLIRRGDILEVPQPRPKVDLEQLSPEARVAEESISNARYAERYRYVLKSIDENAALGAKALPKKAASMGARIPGVRQAKSVMTYSSLSKVPASRIVQEVLNLARENIPQLRQFLEGYDDYVRTYGADSRNALTVDDIVTHPTGTVPHLVPVEINRIKDLFEIKGVTSKDLDGMLGRMFRDMGYSDDQAMQILARYRAAMAEGMSKRMNATFSAQEPFLVDRVLDWGPVAAVRTGNAKVIDAVVKEVKAQGDVVANNVAEFMAEAANDFATKIGGRSALELRVAGVPVIHLTSPESINRAFNAFLDGNNAISKGLRDVSKWVSMNLRGYSQHGVELNSIRASSVGLAERLTATHLNYLHKLYGGMPKREQRDVMAEWLGGATPEVSTKHGEQLASIDSMFLDLRETLPSTLRVGSLEDISPSDIAKHFNRWLDPAYQLDADRLAKTLTDSSADYLTPDWWRDYFVGSYASETRRSKFDAPSALELEWQMRMANEKVIGQTMLSLNLETTFGKVKPVAGQEDASWKVLTDGPPEKRWTTIDSLDSNVYFAPEIRKDIIGILNLVRHRDAVEVAMGRASRVGTFWKASVTVYNIPSYFIRNALSDGWMMFFAGMNPKYTGTGVRVLADTGAYNSALRLNPEFARAFSLADGNNKESLEAAMSLAGRLEAGNANRTAVSFSKGFVDDSGNTVQGLSSIQLLKYYHQLGLDTNFVRTSLASVRTMSPKLSRIGETVKTANSYGEDTRRISLFADGLAKANKAGIKTFDEALDSAAEHVRKYLFDYSDFSNMERLKLGRIVPFYKWTRKALPLLTEMLLLKPGKVSIQAKINEAVNTYAGGYDERTSESNLPWMPTIDAIVSTWLRTNPAMYVGDNTGTEGEQYGTYMQMVNPFTETFSRIVDPVVPGGETIEPNASFQDRLTKYGAGVAAMAGTQVAPSIRMPFELGMQQQMFGANEYGGRPLGEGGITDYISSLFPQITKTQDFLSGKKDITKLQDIIDFMGAANMQDMDPNMMMSEMMFLTQAGSNTEKRAMLEFYRKAFNDPNWVPPE